MRRSTNIVAEITSKLIVEEAKFHDIQERKVELQQAIIKMEQGGSADGNLQRDFDAPLRVTLLSSRVFHSPEAFKLDYEKMEKELRVFVYPDGDPETYFHMPRKVTGKYSSEGYFFKNIKESRFFTADSLQAHLFIPISCHKMRGKLNGYVLCQEYATGDFAQI